MIPALDALLRDVPWRVSKTTYGEAWIVTASGLPLAKVEQEEAAGVLCAGAELHRLAGWVEQLVQAARRVTAIRLRFPTDSHLTPAWAELAVALKPFPVGGDVPPGNSSGAPRPSGGGSVERPPGGTSAPTPVVPVVPEGSSGTPGNPASASALSSFSTTGAEGPSGAAVPQADGHAEPPDAGKQSADGDPEGYGDPARCTASPEQPCERDACWLQNRCTIDDPPAAIYAGSLPADPLGRDRYCGFVDALERSLAPGLRLPRDVHREDRRP